MNTIVAIKMSRPMGVKLKKLKGSMPSRDSWLLTTILGGVPISVSIPPIEPAKAMGISRRVGATPTLVQRFRATGMKTATAPVLLMNADRPATTSISNTRRRTSLVPATPMSQLPMENATPVRKRPSPTIKRPAINMTRGSPKPAKASFGESRPVSNKASTTRMATISIRRRSLAKRTIVAASKAKTNRISPVMTSPRYGLAMRSSTLT